jgi:hypothetical protein
MEENAEDKDVKLEIISKFINEVKKFNLPVGKYTVVGGGALAARGLRETQDVDLMLTEELYEQLKNEGWEEREKRPGYFHIYKDNAEAAKNFLHIEGCKLDSEEVIRNSEIIDGVPVMNLDDLVELKQTMGREKDLKDIEIIKNYKNK